MAKPLNIKPVQIYPSPELYDSIKETVDSGKYRSMNAAVIALIEIGLGHQQTFKQGGSDNTIDSEVIQRLQSEITELVTAMSDTVKREELSLFKNEILEMIASINPDSPVDKETTVQLDDKPQYSYEELDKIESKPELPDEVVSTLIESPDEGFSAKKAFEIAKQRGYTGSSPKSLNDGFERANLGEKYELTRIPVKQGKEKWLYFDSKNLA